ncbi:hypothetical protein IMZ11_41900 [Microtetraspora sp. AC03309]|uniref:hypothetical protein n=1 Tax=Microtetraspora sp. AC03309 TaxID=2779376 RepID=UPI001E2D163D|nr:hypothetical protein [Microtetraspora sp. AC03309]MCC5582165.1 hypothetical protein [Microtetraspora sp. AC03309]
MGHKRPTFLERSERGQCFTYDCPRKPIRQIMFRGYLVWACKACEHKDGLYC